MTALHPELVWLGLALAALPVLIHWFARPRPVAVRFSAMRFLLAVNRDRRRANRLRDLAVLAARVLAVLGIAGAIARPRLSGPWNTEGALDRVVVLDVSQSLGARAGGAVLFERARAAALEKLKGPAGSRFGVVLAGARASQVYPELTELAGPLRRQVADARVEPQALDASAALAAAQALLGEARGGRAREIVVVTDLQRTNWDGIDAAGVASDVRIALEVVAPARPARNLAITGVRPDPLDRGAALVTVWNGSPLALTARVELSGARDRWQRALQLAAWSAGELRFEGVAGAGDAFVTGNARLVGADDDLPADDARAFAWTAQHELRVAVVSAQANQRIRTSSDYLVRALEASGAGRTVERLAPVDLTGAGRHDLYWVLRPGRLDDAAVATLAARARGGCGVVYVAEEATDGLNLRRLAERLWPDADARAHALSGWNGLAAPAESALTKLEVDRLPFRELGPRGCEALSGMAVRTAVQCARVTGPARTEVLAEFADGSTALALAGAGTGAVAVLGLDLAASALTRSPLFVPLVEELGAAVRPREADAASEAGGASDPAVQDGRNTGVDGGAPPAPPALRARSGELACGTLLSLALGPEPSGGAKPQLVAPEGAVAAEEAWTRDAAGIRVSWIAPAPGVWRVRSGDRVLAAVAVACPGAEADLRPARLEDVTARLSAGGRAVRGTQAAATPDEGAALWPSLALCAAIACCVELALLTLPG